MHNMDHEQHETGEVYLRRVLNEWYSTDKPKYKCDRRDDDGRLPPTHAMFEFQITAASRDGIENFWNKSCQEMKRSKIAPHNPSESSRIKFFTGSPGIGKTRSLLELKTILPCGENYIYVSLGGITPLNPVEKDASFEQMIAIRVLQWAARFDYKKSFTLTDCLKVIQIEKGPLCLAIDEMDQPNDVIPEVSREIQGLVLTSESIVFLGSTLQYNWNLHWDWNFGQAGVSATFFGLHHFSDIQVNNILDTLKPPYDKLFLGWRGNPHLRDLLRCINGVPRVLENFVRTCDHKFNDSMPPWDRKQMDSSIGQTDHMLVLGSDTLRQLVKDIIMRREVRRRNNVVGEMSIDPTRTYDDLRSRGIIELLPGSYMDSCCVYAPFARFRDWVTMLVATRREASFGLLDDIISQKYDWKYRTDFGKSEEVKRGFHLQLCFGRLFSTMTTGPFDYVQLKRKLPDIMECLEEFPGHGLVIEQPPNHNKHRLDNGCIYVNPAGSSFADVFFTCRRGNRRRKCIVAIKCISPENGTFTTKDLNEELRKTKDAMNQHREAFEGCNEVFIVVLVTTLYSRSDDNWGDGCESTVHRQIKSLKWAKKSYGIELNQDHIVLDCEGLEHFFPQPLREHAFRSIFRVNVDCAPLDEIRRIFGLDDNQVKEFEDKRKEIGGFVKIDDLPFDVWPGEARWMEF
ncbi:hypothetical protein F5884DRAFT_859145 [Xylogone sp. PMI_703]|nr:hypothetical protein F5884DRAFT_859145 [Xylogone sp. PMI_703]